MLWGLAWVWLRSYSSTNTDYLKIMEAKVKIIMMILVSTAGSSDSTSTCRPASVLWGGTVVLLFSESRSSTSTLQRRLTATYIHPRLLSVSDSFTAATPTCLSSPAPPTPTSQEQEPEGISTCRVETEVLILDLVSRPQDRLLALWPPPHFKLLWVVLEHHQHYVAEVCWWAVM